MVGAICVVSTGPRRGKGPAPARAGQGRSGSSRRPARRRPARPPVASPTGRRHAAAALPTWTTKGGPESFAARRDIAHRRTVSRMRPLASPAVAGCAATALSGFGPRSGPRTRQTGARAQTAPQAPGVQAGSPDSPPGCPPAARGHPGLPAPGWVPAGARVPRRDRDRTDRPALGIYTQRDPARFRPLAGARLARWQTVQVMLAVPMGAAAGTGRPEQLAALIPQGLRHWPASVTAWPGSPFPGLQLCEAPT